MSDASNPAQNLLQAIYGPVAPYYRHFDYERIAYLLAAVQSAEFFMKNFPKTPNYEHETLLLEKAVSISSVEGLSLEFGVYSGTTIRLIAERTRGTVHGFDSFLGLPENWSHFQSAGRFSTGGKPPDNLPENVVLHIGRFDETLPLFIEASKEPVRFLHIDCDLYSSTKTVLQHLGPHFVPGTVIVFNEYLNYPGWQDHEHKAWTEFLNFSKVKFDYVGWASRHTSLAVQIIGN